MGRLLWEAIKVQKEKNSLMELVEYVNFDFFKADHLLDQIIDEAGTLYKIDHPIVKEENQAIVFSKDEIHDMLEFMMKETILHITPSFELILRTSINIDSEADLMNFLMRKIKLYVLSYSQEVQKVTY